MLLLCIAFLIVFVMLGFVYAPMIFDCYSERFWVDFEGICLTMVLTFIGMVLIGIIFGLTYGVIFYAHQV